MSTPDSLYVAVLDAGDQLVEALEASDLAAASEAIARRREIMNRLADAALPPPPPELVERFRQQDAIINTRLQSQLMSLSEAVAMTTHAASAHNRYHRSAASPPVLDTAPRRT